MRASLQFESVFVSPWACQHVCVRACVRACAYVCTCVHVSAWGCTDMACVCMMVCAYVCVHVRICVCRTWSGTEMASSSSESTGYFDRLMGRISEHTCQ